MKEPVDAAAVRIFPPAVPLLTILLGVALNRLCPFKLKLNLSGLSRYGIGGAIVGVAVLGLGLYPVILLRRTGQSENPWTPTTEIVTRGPFKFTRNPLYSQMILGCIGFAIMLRNMDPAADAPWPPGGFRFLPFCQKRRTWSTSSASYRSYKRRVRRWLWTASQLMVDASTLQASAPRS
jgi:protein-S-isoprenylcysteine O-methyltransferase Ste14